MGDVLPPIFLAVAAFLVNVVMTRLVAVEREQIGLMKAFGYSSGRVAWHYLKLAGIIALTGLLLGLGVGVWLGRLMAGMYVIYYNFPFLVFAATPAVYLIGVGVTALAAGGGAFIAVRRAARLEPAVAMRPPPPPDYSRAAGSAVTRWKLLDQQTRMILRQIIRWPVRSGLTVLGIGLSGALLLMTLYFVDAMEELITNYFDESARHDLAVSFVEPRGMDAFHDLMRREGVIYGEPFRAVGASLRFQNREVRLGLTGVVAEPALNRMVDAQDQGVAPAPGGLLLSQDIAERLGVRPGDVIRAEVSEGRRPDLDLPVVAAPLVLIGSGAQMRLEELNAALGEGRVISGAWLKVDPDRLDTLYDELKAAPLVAGVELHHESRTTFKELMDRSIGVAIFIYTIFAGLIALGVIYNAVRISFAERARELASLRVLGFSRADVSYILLGEAGLLTLAAIPVGLVLGTGLSWFMAGAMSSDMFRLPFVIEPSSYAYCALVLAVIAAGSALIVRRRIDRLNLVEVLKTRE
jgi:putative ABC transport system permease protein